MADEQEPYETIQEVMDRNRKQALADIAARSVTERDEALRAKCLQWAIESSDKTTSTSRLVDRAGDFFRFIRGGAPESSGLLANPLERLLDESRKVRDGLADQAFEIDRSASRLDIERQRVEWGVASVAALDSAIAALKERFPEWAPTEDTKHALT